MRICSAWRPRVVGGVEVVALAVVALHRGGQAREGLRDGRADAVERDGRADPVALLRGEQQHEAAAHAEADGADASPLVTASWASRKSTAPAEVAGGLVDGQLAS